MTTLRGKAVRATIVLHVHGLERVEDVGAPPSDNYPPYDVLRVPGTDGAPNSLRLVLAVAGFGPEQLEISVSGDQLFVSGENAAEVDPRRFLHRGIAGRRFRRAFRLAPGLDVEGADLDRGLLTVLLTLRDPGCAGRIIAIRSSVLYDGTGGAAPRHEDHDV